MTPDILCRPKAGSAFLMREEVMADCEFLTKCIFFNDKMENMPAIAGTMKERYCRGFPDQCARYRVAVKFGPEKVPRDLFPHDTVRAKIIISFKDV